MPDKMFPQPPSDGVPLDNADAANRSRLAKLIRVAIKQAQSEGEVDAVYDLLAILKTLNVSAPAIVASMAVIRMGLGGGA